MYSIHYVELYSNALIFGIRTGNSEIIFCSITVTRGRMTCKSGPRLIPPTTISPIGRVTAGSVVWADTKLNEATATKMATMNDCIFI